MLLLDLELFACVKVHRPFPQHHFKGNLETMLVACIDSTFKNGLVSTLLFFFLFSMVECVSLRKVYCNYERFEVSLSQ